MLRYIFGGREPSPPPPPANPPPAQPEVIFYPTDSEDEEEDKQRREREEAVRAAKRRRGRSPALGGAAREPEPAAAEAPPEPAAAAQPPLAAVEVEAPCEHPVCKQNRRHCAVCDRCLSQKGSRVCRAPDYKYYCMPEHTPAEHVPAAFAELHRMRDKSEAQIENLRAEREVNRAEIRQLQADLKALQERSGMCETCERHTPQCIMCLKRPAELAVLPCGHRVYCTAADCKPAPAPGATCPVCNGPRLIVQRIF